MYDRSIKVLDEPHTPEQMQRLVEQGPPRGKLISDAHGDSYMRQMRTIRRLKAESVLEVGPGEGSVRDYLKSLGTAYDTVDIIPQSEPTFLARLEDLDTTALAGRWDLTCAFQVLEHSPYESFRDNLIRLATLSRRWVYISVPYSCRGFRLDLTFSGGQNRTSRRGWSFYRATNLPNRRYRPEFMAEFPWAVHWWEIGRQGFPLQRILGDVAAAGLRVVEREHGANPFHYFILAEKR